MLKAIVCVVRCMDAENHYHEKAYDRHNHKKMINHCFWDNDYVFYYTLFVVGTCRV